LSIVVPVRNAEAALTGQVERLLEVLPELTPRFEILVIDDGSTDHTADVARELACRYPQLRLVRHTQPRGAAATIHTGLCWAKGQTVFVQDDPAALSATDPDSRGPMATICRR
jgi:glycosyltransferase involved in cell wall biosynthesis